MGNIDWLVLFGTLTFIVTYGIYRTRGSENVHEYLKGGKAKWWTIGLSVMATQASAITFLSTPGQAFSSGMGFVQFYFCVPVRMVILWAASILIYHRLKVSTSSEYLEGRCGLNNRPLTPVFVLMQRRFAVGITSFAPAIILTAVLGWNLILLNAIIGMLA